jgi:hypothetical protein
MSSGIDRDVSNVSSFHPRLSMNPIEACLMIILSCSVCEMEYQYLANETLFAGGSQSTLLHSHVRREQ